LNGDMAELIFKVLNELNPPSCCLFKYLLKFENFKWGLITLNVFFNLKFTTYRFDKLSSSELIFKFELKFYYP